MNELLLWNSLMLGLGATAFAMVLGVGVGIWAWGARDGVRSALWVATLTAFAMPPFFLTNAWLDWVAGTAASPGTGGWGLFSVPGAMFLMGLQLWPIATLAVWAAEGAIAREQFECEPALRGARLLRFLIFPLLRPFLTVAGVLIFALALNQFSIPTLLQVHVLSAEIWMRYLTELDPRKAWQVGWPLMVVPLLGLWLIPKWTRFRFRWKARDWSGVWVRQLGRGYDTAAIGAGALAILLSIVLPWARTVGAARTWSQWWPALQTSTRALAHSFGYSAATATSAVGLALVFCWIAKMWGDAPYRTSARVRWMRACVRLSWVFLFVPGTAIAIAMIHVSTNIFSGALHATFLGGWIALHLHYGAVGTQLTWQSVQSLDPHLVDASKIYAPTRAFWLREVVWPSIGGTVMVAWYAVYLLTLWDIESLVLLQVPGGETLALRIFNLLHYGHNDQVNALAIQLLIMALLPLGGFGLYRALRRGFGRTPRLGLAAVAIAWMVCGCSRQETTSAPPSLALKTGLFREVLRVGGRGTAAGEFNKPRSLTVDTQDNLYVVDMTGRVQKFSPTGQFLLMWQLPQTDLGKPKGMSRDPDGNILVVEPHYQRINHFSPQGQLLRQWGKQGNELGQLVLPRAVTVGSNRLVYVSEYTTVDRVQAFEFPNMTFRFAFGKSGAGNGEFNRPESLCVDAQNHIFVADSCNHRIEFFSELGEYLGTFGKPGTGPGELSYPYDVQIDSAGNCFVCEFGNSRIQIFDARHQTLEMLGGYGDRLDQFNNPWSLTLDSKGNLYVADAGNHRVLKYLRR